MSDLFQEQMCILADQLMLRKLREPKLTMLIMYTYCFQQPHPRCMRKGIWLFNIQLIYTVISLT